MPSGHPGQVDFWASSFSFPLAQWARDQASRLLTEVLKEQTKTCSGQEKIESYLFQGQAGIQLFRALCQEEGALKEKTSMWGMNLFLKKTMSEKYALRNILPGNANFQTILEPRLSGHFIH